MAGLQVPAALPGRRPPLACPLAPPTCPNREMGSACEEGTPAVLHTLFAGHDGDELLGELVR